MPASSAPRCAGSGHAHGLAATAGNQQISLTWTASSGATSYHVKRATTSGGPYTQVGAPTSASYIDTGLTNGTTVLLCGIGAECERGERKFEPGQCDPRRRRGARCDHHGGSDEDQVDFAVDLWPQLLYRRLRRSAAPHPGPCRRQSLDRIQLGDECLECGQRLPLRKRRFLTSSTTPAEAVRSFVAADQSLDMASVMTVQLQGLVSGDESGPVSITNPPDLTRFKQAIDKKSTITPAAFTETPAPPTPTFIWTNFCGRWTRRSREFLRPTRRCRLS